MSIIRMLTRLTAVSALRGRTWAADRVFDSDNTPLSQALALNEAAKPYIVVFTDADNRPDIGNTDLFIGRREVTLTLEIGVASKIEGEVGKEEIKIPLTDEGMEVALDMVEDQAMATLWGDPQGDWSELLKGLVLRVDRVAGQRGASTTRDRRWAARQVSFICDVVSDLPPGVPVPHDHPIRLFCEVSKANPEAQMQPIAKICEALISREAAPKWEQVQAWMGVRRIGLRAIGQAPLSADMISMRATLHGDDLTDKYGEAPILRKITHDDMQMETHPEIGLNDEFAIETNIALIKPKPPKDKIEADD